MWNGKLKAFTFSFDDGIEQDKRAIEILNKYGIKATFNLNSGHMGRKNTLNLRNREIRHDKISADEIADVYRGHEIAVHTVHHPMLTRMEEKDVIREVEDDRLALEALCGYSICGMAYPCGGENNDDRVAQIIRDNTPIKYARGLDLTYDFDLQDNLLRFKPTLHYANEKLFELAQKFIDMKPDTPQLFYVWGHTYEMDAEYITWEKFEEFCALISGHDDIYYCTNREGLLEK